jgi:lipopolysaccharide transport system ATP-binding protein
MSDAVITVENLSKSYLVGHKFARQGPQNDTLRDVIVREAHNFARKAADVVRGRQIVQGDDVEEFWALKDVSFEVKQGEAVGIIGQNGAGKSTLLKILSRITEPTAGRVTLRGRVASLLEVGTGFHAELSGRENIFLNGAILGMTQREIRKKFDEIVTFADVERFLDTPVKRYSSGMYVRLAFAVAAHLSPEILIIDEVLAVGDAKFQEKCLGKMRDEAASGRTVLFVSHNMNAILQLTKRAILLSNGAPEFAGSSDLAVERYLYGQRLDRTVEFEVHNTKRRYETSGDVRIVLLRFSRPLPRFGFLEPINYIVRVKAERTVDRIRTSMTIFAHDGSPVGSCFGPEIVGLACGEERELAVSLPSLRLAPGSYFCGVSIGRGDHRSTHLEYDSVHETLFFDVMSEETKSGALAEWHQGWGSISSPEMANEWKLELA